MLNELLWLWDAKLQYERQKAQGLAGLTAILSVILLVWKWDEWFYPLFENIGFVGLVERTGLVHDLSVVTIINVIAVIFFISLFIAATCFSVFFLGFLLICIGASKVGQTIIFLATFPVIVPFLLFFPKRKEKKALRKVASSAKELKEIQKKYKHLDNEERNWNLFLEQLNRTDEDFKVEKWEPFQNMEAKKHLNRVLPSIKENTDFLIGYHKYEKKLYILFPNPLPAPISRSFEIGIEESGLYGFEGQCLSEMKGLSMLSPSPSYYVPALGVTVVQGEDKLHLIVEQSTTVKPFDLYWMADYYRVQSTELKELIRSLSKERIDLQRCLQQAHVAFYLFPTYSHKREVITDGKVKYFNESKNVLHADTFRGLYQADVEKEIIKYAKDGEEWAINWFKKVE